MHLINKQIDTSASSILKKSKTKILIASKSSWHVIDKNEIAFFQADCNYTKLFIGKDSQLLTSKTLKYFNELLGSRFLRVHQSFLVNPIFISSFHKSMEFLTLKNGEEIPISRSRRKLVREFMRNYYD